MADNYGVWGIHQLNDSMFLTGTIDRKTGVALKDEQDDQLRRELKILSVEIRELFRQASEEAKLCHTTLSSIHPENLTPMLFAKLRNATLDLSDVYTASLEQLATGLEDIVALSNKSTE